MITSDMLQHWIEHPEVLNRDTLYQLRTALERYPYFSSLRLLALKNLYLLHDDNFGNELRKSAIYVADRHMLFQLIEGEHYALLAEEKDKKEEQPTADIPMNEEQEDLGLDRTLSLIDHFLEVKPKEEVKKQEVPANYATDYVAYLMQQEEEHPVEEPSDKPKSHGDELLEGFIENKVEFKFTPDSLNAEMPQPVGPKLDNFEEDEGCFTETLAKIYIKQRRYDKALEIIRKLYLKNPKKNTYFADQIRFLEKLIINDKFK